MSTVGIDLGRGHSALPATVLWLVRLNLRVAGWAVAILAIAMIAGTTLVDAIAQVEISVVQFARQGFIWFPFSVAIMIATSFTGVSVAAGVTRRVLGRATLLVALGTGAFYTLVMTAALQVERLVYGARGWAQQLTDASPVFTDTSQVGWILADLGLVFTAAQLSGLLVGQVYYRGGGWWGTLTLPLTVGPVLLVSPLLTTSWLDPISPLARVPLAVGLLALTAVAYLAVLRATPVRPVSA